MSGDVYNVSDIYNDVKREGEIILGREMTEKEITDTCEAMLSDFTDQLWESGYFDSVSYTDEDLQADKDLFNETFVDNLKERLPNIIDESRKENLKGFNRANDTNGNAVLKAFYKDGTSEIIRGGRVTEFYIKYGVKSSDYNKSYKTIDGLRQSTLKQDKSRDI